MSGRVLEFVGRHLASYLNTPVKGFVPRTTANPAAVKRALKLADVILVEGDSRVSSVIKYMTQSTWSHAALYVGPIPGRSDPDGEPHDIVEANLGEGVVSAPRSKYAAAHTRICRAVGLNGEDREAVASYAIGRIGHEYDLKNVVDLARFLLPPLPIPMRYRRRMLAMGSGSPTRAICSTLIAQAFHSVRYPILSRVERIAIENAGDELMPMHKEILHIRHHSLFAPRDFDISPFFAVVKPSVEAGFDFRTITWGDPYFDVDEIPARGR